MTMTLPFNFIYYYFFELIFFPCIRINFLINIINIILDNVQLYMIQPDSRTRVNILKLKFSVKIIISSFVHIFKNNECLKIYIFCVQLKKKWFLYFSVVAHFVASQPVHLYHTHTLKKKMCICMRNKNKFLLLIVLRSRTLYIQKPQIFIMMCII